MKRNCAVALLFLLASPVLAIGQDCTIAAYLDPGGTVSADYPEYNYDIGAWDFSVYVVIFAEDTVAAAAYSMTFDTTSDGPYLQNRLAGPSGLGLWINEPTGTNVALRECVIGFGGSPVLVDEYQFLAFDPNVVIFIRRWPGATFSLGPNPSQDPELPQYVTCNDITKSCAIGPDLQVLADPISTGSRSFSAVKSLFRRG